MAVLLQQEISPCDRIVRIGKAGRAEPFRAPPVAASGDVWSQLKVEEYRQPPGEESAGAPTQHLVVLNMGAAYRRELTWGDQPGVLRYTFEPGHVAIIPAGVTYHPRWLDEGHALLLQVNPALVPVPLAREFNARDEFLSHLMLALRDALHHHGQHARLCGEHLAGAVATHLAKRYAAGASHAGTPPPVGLPMNRMRRVAEHIEGHLDAPLSLRELAGIADMSVFHFARLFKARIGLPPHQYVLRKRIDRAKELLGNPSPAIAEIAVRCGFSHQPHFTKAFHEIAGVTPGEWRGRAAGRPV